MSFSIIALQDIIDDFGEDFAKSVLSDFSCPMKRARMFVCTPPVGDGLWTSQGHKT